MYEFSPKLATKTENYARDDFTSILLSVILSHFLSDVIAGSLWLLFQENSLDRFQWMAAFCVGDNQVDEQHKKIFELLAALHRDIHGDDADDAVKRTLKELLEYTKVHFADEEALMRSIDYPDYDKHKALHDDLMDKVWGLYMRCNEGDSSLAIELLVFLNDWLVDHILEKDKAITAYVRKRNGMAAS